LEELLMNRHSVSNKFALAVCFAVVIATAEGGGVSGAIFTTVADGSVANANQYDSKCGVYLNGGPGPHAPAKAAGLPDGDYYFQVTDPTGAQLLNTDPVSNRRFHVSGGVITAFTGTGGPPHPTGISVDHPELGAITISLANSGCPVDFLNTSSSGNVYKVWATPVGSYVGNTSNVDNPCGNGCSHGFLASQSKTDNFRAQAAAAATFCLTLQKQLNTVGVLTPLPGWIFEVTDPAGVTNHFTTDSTGQVMVCQLVAGTYSVTEDLTDVNQPPPFTPPLPFGCFVSATATLNGAPSPIPVTFTWNAAQPSTMTVSLANALLCQG
jgi:hypothetical protein